MVGRLAVTRTPFSSDFYTALILSLQANYQERGIQVIYVV